MPIYMKFDGIDGEVTDVHVKMYGQEWDGRLIFEPKPDAPSDGVIHPATYSSIETLLADPEILVKGCSLLVPVRMRALFERVKIMKGVLPFFEIKPPGVRKVLRVDGATVTDVRAAGEEALVVLKPQNIIAILIGL